MDTESGPPGAAQLQAVLRSTSRSHELTVVDLPRIPEWITDEVSRHADLFVLVVRADVRGVSAARAVLDQLAEGPRPQVLVRTRRSGSLTAVAVADGLGTALLGTVPDDNAIRSAAERGDPPARSARSPLALTCRAILARLEPHGGGRVTSTVNSTATDQYDGHGRRSPANSIRFADGWPVSVAPTTRRTWPTPCGPRGCW